jgi:uncharacterized protein (DUF433 family)
LYFAKKIIIMNIYKDIITIDSDIKNGQPCIRGMRISVENILRLLSTGMTIEEIIYDFPELTKEDILTAIEFTAEKLHRTFVAA